MERDSIKWSQNPYSLSDLVAQCALPCVIKVVDGHYGTREDLTISSEDILILHRVNSTRVYRATAEDGRELFIPMNLEAKVESVERKVPQVWESVRRLSEAFPKRVISLHDHPWLGIGAGDVLSLQSITGQHRTEYLQCSLVNGQRKTLIPLSYEASFQSVDDDHIWLSEVADRHALPRDIKVMDKTLKVTQSNDDGSETEFRLSDLGRVTLHEVHNRSVILVSDYQGNRHSWLRVPVELGITVTLAMEGVTWKNLASVLRDATLEDKECIRISNQEAMVERIYDDLETDDEHDYLEVAPPIPPRDSKPSRKKTLSRDTNPARNTTPLRDTNPSRNITPSRDTNPSHNITPSRGTNPSRNTTPQQHDTQQSRSEVSQQPENDSSSESEDYEEYQLMSYPSIPPRLPRRTASLKSFEEDKSQASTIGVQPNKYEVSSVIQSLQTNLSAPLSKEIVKKVSPSPGGFCIPDNLQGLSVQDVGQCLDTLRMSEYSDRFAAQLIDGSMLVELTDDILAESLDMRDKLHRIKLVKFINGWRPV